MNAVVTLQQPLQHADHVTFLPFDLRGCREVAVPSLIDPVCAAGEPAENRAFP